MNIEEFKTYAIEVLGIQEEDIEAVSEECAVPVIYIKGGHSIRMRDNSITLTKAMTVWTKKDMEAWKRF